MQRQLSQADQKTHSVVFIDDIREQREVNGLRVLRYAEFLAHESPEKFFNIAVSDPKHRQRLAEQCLADGLLPFPIRAAESVCYEPNEIGVGSILCAYSVVTVNATIGRFFHANINSYVAHDCVIGDFVTFAPRVNCNGRVIVEDFVTVGTGAVIRNGEPGGAPIVIGTGAVVGMGAVVTRSVPPGITVVGNPAREISSTVRN